MWVLIGLMAVTNASIGFAAMFAGVNGLATGTAAVLTNAQPPLVLLPAWWLYAGVDDATCSLDGDLVVLRARFTEEVVVRGEMDHRGDMGAVMLTEGTKAVAHAVIEDDFDRPVHAVRWRGCFAVDADDVGVASDEAAHDGLADPAVGAGDDDDPAVRCHGLRRRVDRGDANELLVHELLDAQTGELTSVPGVLDTPERQVWCRPGRVVDENQDTAVMRVATDTS